MTTPRNQRANTTTANTTAGANRTVIEPVNLDAFLSEANMDMAIYRTRLATYTGVWRYEEQKGDVCTAERMARAGFYCTETKPGADAARCYVCQHELYWDPKDDPWEEHRKHRPDCLLVQTGKQDEGEFTVLEQLKILAYIYSTRNYKYVNEAISDLCELMDKLVGDSKKLIRDNPLEMTYVKDPK